MFNAFVMNKIANLCKFHRVRRMHLFGSARQDAERANDYDFLIEFEAMTPGEHAQAFFGLLEDLEKLLGKPIDLVELRAIRNPYFKAEIESTKVPVYEAA